MGRASNRKKPAAKARLRRQAESFLAQSCRAYLDRIETEGRDMERAFLHAAEAMWGFPPSGFHGPSLQEMLEPEAAQVPTAPADDGSHDDEA